MIRRHFFLLLLLLAGLWSCKKTYDIAPAQDTGLKSYVNVINSTPNTLNFYLNGTRQNSASSIYTGGATGYLSLITGQNNYDFKNSGSSDILFTKTLALKDTLHQTLYVTGTSADKVFLMTDTLVTNSTTGKVRFANTADGAGSLTVTINDTLYFSNQNYKAVSAFKNIAVGLKTIKMYTPGSTVVSATQKLNFSTGNLYTLYVKGLPNGTGASVLTIGYFVNK